MQWVPSLSVEGEGQGGVGLQGLAALAACRFTGVQTTSPSPSSHEEEGDFAPQGLKPMRAQVISTSAATSRGRRGRGA
jgi:hypothetical protein